MYGRLLGCFLWLSFFYSNGASIFVGSQYACKTIHSALAIAKNGDTILVQPGLYKEQNITITTPVSLIGINYPVLDGEKKYEIVSVKSHYVTVEGFHLRNSGHSDLNDIAGIKIYDSRNVRIKNNILEDTFFGIYTQYGTNCTIEANKLTAHAHGEMEIGNGIHCWKSDSMRIINNTVEGHRDGIYFEFVTNSTIGKNVSFKNLRYGLHFMFSDNDEYLANTFRNNGAGVAVMYSKRVNMFNNRFEDNWGDAAYGLLLKEMSYGHIKYNTFKNNTVGITLEGGSSMRVEENDFRNNGYAMKVMANCRLDTFTRNNFWGNTFDAATNGKLQENLFEYNYWDKYEGYDLNRNTVGDIPYHPVSLYAVLVEQMPYTVMLMHSFTVDLLSRIERNVPSIVPDTFVDESPSMRPIFWKK